MKRCPRCEITKEPGEFYKSAKNGLSPYCKPCSAARKRKGNKTRAEIAAETYPAPGLKRCSGCREARAVAEFSTKGDGRLRPKCRTCRQDMHRAWVSAKPGRQPSLPRGQRLAIIRLARQPTAHTRVCTACSQEKPILAFGAVKGEYRFKCRECRAVETRRRYALSKERHAKKRAEARVRDPLRVRTNAINGFHKRRARMKAVEATLTTAEWKQIRATLGDRCLCCGVVEGIALDHIIPISKGGGHVADNVQPLCMACNSSKGTKVIDYRPKSDTA